MKLDIDAYMRLDLSARHQVDRWVEAHDIELTRCFSVEVIAGKALFHLYAEPRHLDETGRVAVETVVRDVQAEFPIELNP